LYPETGFSGAVKLFSCETGYRTSSSEKERKGKGFSLKVKVYQAFFG
jgi:hypothetical protein